MPRPAWWTILLLVTLFSVILPLPTAATPTVISSPATDLRVPPEDDEPALATPDLDQAGDHPLSMIDAAQLTTTLGRLPLAFVPNAGQVDSAVHFHARGLGGNLFFAADEVVVAVEHPVPHTVAGVHGPSSQRRQSPSHVAAQGHRPVPSPAPPPTVIRLQYRGANAAPVVTGTTRLPGVVNFFVGNHPSTWRTNIPTYAGIRYQALYPGIDLHYAGADGYLKGTYTVAPGGDPDRIRWRYQGATAIQLDGSGKLVITLPPSPGGAPGGRPAPPTLVEHAPIAWQHIQGQQVPVAVRYALAADRTVSFVVAAYDRTQPLIIDPTLTVSTYLGGSGDDEAQAIAIGSTGDLFVTGTTLSPRFPQSQASGTQPDRAAVVTRLDATGQTLLYSTFLGGTGADYGSAIAIDPADQAVVAGMTSSPDFPLAQPLQSTKGAEQCAVPPCSDAFVARLDPTGSRLLASTYLGGSGDDSATGIALDAAQQIAVAGHTTSANFPTANPFQPTNGDDRCTVPPCQDAFVTALTAAGTALRFSTYLGGTDLDSASAIAVDGSGNAVVTGITASTDFPVTQAVQATLGGGFDAFVTQIGPDGTALRFSTYLGGSEADFGEGIAVDGGGNVYVTGGSASSNFPVRQPLAATAQGGLDAVVTKLTAQGTSLAWSTYLGGSGSDIARAITVDATGAVTVVGATDSPTFPVQQPIQGTLAGNDDLFVTRFQPAGDRLAYSTFLGGAGDDVGEGVALGQAGTAAVVGTTSSDTFPLASPWQHMRAGGSDVVVALVSDPSPPDPPPTPTPTPAPAPAPTAAPPDPPVEPDDPCAARSAPSGTTAAIGTSSVATALENESFEIGSQPLAPETYPANCAFSQGRQALPVTGLVNPDFGQGLTGWTPAAPQLVEVVNDDPRSPGGAHLRISGAEVAVVSSAFVVPAAAQSLHFDYLVWSERTAVGTSSLELLAIRPDAPDLPLPMGSVYGTLHGGWQHAVVDLQALRGATIQLRLRTQWDAGRARIDNLVIHTEVPDWTISNAAAVQVVNDDPQSPGGPHLLLGGAEQWALSPAFTVPPAAQSLHLDYRIWGAWTATAARSLEVVAVRATAPNDPVSVGTLYGVLHDGWQTAVLDLHAVRGETIQLRFRTDWYGGQARIDNLALMVETPGWTPGPSQAVQIMTEVPAPPVAATAPGNASFEEPGGVLAPSAGPVNADFSAGPHSTAWSGFTFTGSSLIGWSVSDPSVVGAMSDPWSIDDGYLLLNAADQVAVSPVLTVPADTQSLRFAYMAWASTDPTAYRAITVESLSGPQFTTVTPLGQVYGSEALGWRQGAAGAVLDLAGFGGQPIKLRFRSDWNQGRARIDSLRLEQEVPGWTLSNAGAVRIAQEGSSPGGGHLRLLGAGQWATSSAFVVAETVQSLHVDYLAWDSTDPTGQRVVAVEVEALSGPRFTTTTRLGRVWGSAALGWQQGAAGAILDLHGFQGQPIKLRVRTDDQSAGASARIDTLQLRQDIPQWTLSDSALVRRVQDAAAHPSALHITAGRQWAASEPFGVPLDAERLRVDYAAWSVTRPGEPRTVGIEVQSGDRFATTTLLGTLAGTSASWQTVLLDLTPFQGRTIRLRLRTGEDTQARIDQVRVELGTLGAPRGTDLAPDTSHLLLSQGERAAISAPFVVPERMTSLYFDYLTWTDDSALAQRGLTVEVLRAGVPPVLLGTVYGSGIQGWRQALLDVSSLHGQTIQLRFRTDWQGGKAKLDNVGDPNLIVSIYNQRAATPPTRPADVFYARDNWGEKIVFEGVRQTRAYVAGYTADQGEPYSQIILAFGRQRYDLNQPYPGAPATRAWGVNLAFEGGNQSNGWVRARAEEFIAGYQAGHPGEPSSIAIGTSNGTYPWTCDNRRPETLSPDWRAAGLVWGKLVTSLGQPEGVVVRSANDIESWYGEEAFADDPATPEVNELWVACGLGAMDWYAGYRASGAKTPNVFFGSNAWQEYAQTDAQNTINSPVGQWTIEQLYHVAYGFPGTRALPQIYCAGQAESWVQVRRYRPIRFWGVLSDNASDLRRACGGQRGFSWQRSWTELDSKLRTAQPTAYPNHVQRAVTSFNYPNDE